MRSGARLRIGWVYYGDLGNMREGCMVAQDQNSGRVGLEGRGVWFAECCVVAFFPVRQNAGQANACRERVGIIQVDLHTSE